jgi:hypothetical protein
MHFQLKVAIATRKIGANIGLLPPRRSHYPPAPSLSHRSLVRRQVNSPPSREPASALVALARSTHNASGATARALPRRTKPSSEKMVI